MKLKRLIITCGGTGGHFYPGLSIARKFKENTEQKVCLLLSGVNSLHQQQIAAKFGVDAFVLPRMPHVKKAPFQFFKGLVCGVISAYKMTKKFKPNAVLAMGSFASSPVALVAVFLRIPLFLHDGNVRIGRANRLLSKVATGLAVAYPPINGNKCGCPWKITGMPLREELINKRHLSRIEAFTILKQRFGVNLNEDYPTLLIFGGSQGAEIFNIVLPKALKNLAITYKFQVLHLTGKGKSATAKSNYNEVDFPLLLLETDEHMEEFLAAADLVCSRSGGSTIAELTLFGKTAILVPYPFAANDHQTDNAHYLVDNDAAVMVANKDFAQSKVEEILKDFFSGNSVWKERAQHAFSLACPDAALAMIEYMESNL